MPDGSPGPGHNSGETVKGYSAQRLKAFIQRIERLEEEQKALASDKREVYAELKSAGYDPKIVRKVIARRKLDAADLAEQEALLDVYLDAIGDLKDTPLGNAALNRLKKSPAVKRFAKDIKDGKVSMEFTTGGKKTILDKDGMREEGV